MIEVLQSLAKKIRWAKPFILIIGLVFFGLFLTTVLGVEGMSDDVYLIPGVLGVIWAALFFTLISIFPYVPARPARDTALLAKLKIRIKRGLYYILGVLLIVLTMAVIFISFRMLVIWRADF